MWNDGNDAVMLAKVGVIALRETGLAMWPPRYETIAQALRQHNRATSIRMVYENHLAIYS
jgi:hypothetical protein